MSAYTKLATASSVCADCIGEVYLHEQITQNGAVGYCDYCQSYESPTIKLSEMAERTHSVLEEYFHMTSTDPEGIDWILAKEGLWTQPGEPVTRVIVSFI